MAARVQVKGWTKMTNPAKLTNQQWYLTSLVGVVFLVMALLQLIGFSDFKNWLESIGISAATECAVVLIVAEVLASLAFFRIPLMAGLRMLAAWLAILAGGFWFIENLRLVSDGKAGQLSSSGFFGKYLNQSPGWWTVIEVTIFLFLVVWSLYLTRPAWSRMR
jgi:hypothetical protein